MEALAAISITALLGSVMLMSVTASLVESADRLDRTVAQGLAEQLMDEIACRPLPPEWAVAVSTGGARRADFDDVDDYDGWRARPPVDEYGEALGTEGGEVAGAVAARPGVMQAKWGYLGWFEQQVTVEPVRYRDDLQAWEPARRAEADVRLVTVVVRRYDRSGQAVVLAELRRIFARPHEEAP